MANADPLVQLKDIHLPTPVGWWPPAPGWVLISAGIFFLAMAIVYFTLKKHRNAMPKKKALILLKNYQQIYEREGNAALVSAGISELLRRVALAYFPREQVASLKGREWLKFLNETGKGIDFNLVKVMLLETPFKTEETMDLRPLFQAAQLWIQQRRGPCSN